MSTDKSCFLKNCGSRLTWLIHLTGITDSCSKLYDRHRRIYRILVRCNPSQNKKTKREGNLSPFLSQFGFLPHISCRQGYVVHAQMALGRGPRGGPRTAMAHSRCSINTCWLYGDTPPFCTVLSTVLTLTSMAQKLPNNKVQSTLILTTLASWKNLSSWPPCPRTLLTSCFLLVFGSSCFPHQIKTFQSQPTAGALPQTEAEFAAVPAIPRDVEIQSLPLPPLLLANPLSRPPAAPSTQALPYGLPALHPSPRSTISWIFLFSPPCMLCPALALLLTPSSHRTVPPFPVPLMNVFSSPSNSSPLSSGLSFLQMITAFFRISTTH